MKHISIRVPWHDSNWNGHVCKNPACNTFCKVLPRISMSRDTADCLHASEDWSLLPQHERPVCASENGGFMNQHSYKREFKHVYAGKGGRHDVLKPTTIEIPAYSALAIPFRYMSLDSQSWLSDRHPEFHDVEKSPFNSSWLYGAERLDLAKINRLILIGDPCQLPPIGAGRPFADLCYRLQNKDTVPVLNSAITSLETVVRTITTGESDILTLASWFSSKKPKKGADEIFNKMATGDLNGDLQVMTWTDESDLEKCLMEALCIELGCTEDNLSAVLQHRLGIDSIKSLAANPNTIESVQVLTPVLNPIWGSLHLNECVQKWIGTYDKEFIQFSTQKIYPKDKIMQLKNEKVEAYPSHQKYQLSNGQIGFVRSIYKGYANLIYAGIPNESFGKRGVSGEDSETPIELAYSITIHKSQGSDFNTVVLVLPKFGRILTRELIYTALTRAKKKLILLIQDNVYWLWEKTKPQASILAQRNSNMFEQLVARENKSSIPYVEGLIHRTKNPNLMVRSKSEVIIANELISADIKFKYEEMFNRDGHQCLPDFTFVDLSDEIIIWEHLGMLTVPEYKTSWEKKLKFYNSIGFIEGENLFTTHDHENGSIDTTEIMKVIDKIKNLVE